MDNATSNTFIDKDDQTSSHQIKLVPVKLGDFVNAIAFNKKYNNTDIVKVKLNDRDLQSLVQIDSSEIDTPRNKNMINDQIFTIASLIGATEGPNTRKSKRKIDSSTSLDRFQSAKSRVDSIRRSQRRSDKYHSPKSKIDPRITVYRDSWDSRYYTDEPSKMKGSELSWQPNVARKRNSSNRKSCKHSSSRIWDKYESNYIDHSSRERRKSILNRGKRGREPSRKTNVGPNEREVFEVKPDSLPEKLVAETSISTDQSSREDVMKYAKYVGISTNDEGQCYTNNYCKVCGQHCEFCFCQVPYTKTYSERECKRLKCGCWACDIYGLPTQKKKKPGLLDRICETLLKPKCYFNALVHNGPEKTSREDYHPKEFNLQRAGKDEVKNQIICDSCIVTACTTPVIDKTGKLHLVLNKRGHPI